MIITQAAHLKAVGPYSIAREVNGTLYVSGQIALNKQGKLLEEDAVTQFHQIMENLQIILTQAGYQLGNIYKVGIYATDITTFSQINQAYAEYFQAPYPVRTFVEVSSLPLGAKIELEFQASH